MALTGSANKSAIEDIKESLALRDPVCLKQSFNRSNLYYKVKKKPSQKKELLKEMAGFIQSHHKDDTGIIYCLSREDCEDVARRLREEFDLSARHFHAGMDRDTKRINQEDWSNGRCKIIVATVSHPNIASGFVFITLQIAFGMGIDKPDGSRNSALGFLLTGTNLSGFLVRFVIHATMSKDMDGYVINMFRRVVAQSGVDIIRKPGERAGMESLLTVSSVSSTVRNMVNLTFSSLCVLRRDEVTEHAEKPSRSKQQASS